MNDFESKAMKVFMRALERDLPQQQREYVEELCSDCEDLRRAVHNLLRAHAEAGGFLGGGGSRDERVRNTEEVGDRIGPYELREKIAEGGMGVVYEAAQFMPVTRKVALKLIKPGMDSSQVIARFQGERQALAMMDHPNIATVLDAGTADSGRPYFVMDLVRGLNIVEHCDKYKLATRGRLELFVAVCRAVQHAHQKGIIHRDIKPSNVLVASGDPPVPKVIDFGIAKATGQRTADQTVLSQFMQLMGTPLYMSPEQASLAADIDTRTDVYSLGVLLYELLTGETPFEKEMLTGASYDEIRRIVREDEPPKPSARVSTLGADLSSTAAQRSTGARQLVHLLRGELDWIVMKAMQKDRDQRYSSANELADDVRRYLNDEPVLASPPSMVYQLRKLAKRHRVALTTSAVVLLALVIATVVSGWQARVAKAERDRSRLVALVQQQIQIRYREHEAGWSTEVWNLGREAAVIERGDEVRNQTAAALVGLDAVRFKEFGFGANVAVFNPKESSLLIGATGTSTGTFMWSSDEDQLDVLSQSSPALLAFSPDGKPLQLVVDERLLFAQDPSPRRARG